MEQGWIKLFRSLTDNPIWRCEPFTRGQAWVDLLMLANYDRSYFFKRGVKIVVERGQVARSEVELADRWKWSRTKVRKFLNDLEKEQQIIQHKSNITQLLTVVNYNYYQEKEQQTGQQKNSRKTAEEQQKNTLKEEEENKEEKESYKRKLLSEISISDFPELNSDYLETAKAFQQLFKTNLLQAGASTTGVDKVKGSSIDDIRLMMESDRYTLEDLREVYRFLQKDAFWKANILSTSKLREKMPKLKMKIHSDSDRTIRKEGTTWDELAGIVQGAFNDQDNNRYGKARVKGIKVNGIDPNDPELFYGRSE